VNNKGYTVEQMHRTTQYFDGLGRPIETVAWQMSGDKRDIVTVHEYDEFGREQYQWLPFASKLINGKGILGDGRFKANAFTQQAAFCSTEYPQEGVYYSHTVYEASPLNRVIKTFAPGNSWAGSEETVNEKCAHTTYLVNTSDENIRIWTIGYPDTLDAAVVPSSPGAYATGKLFKTINTDEQGRQVIEYKDLEGHIILKKVQVADSTNITTGHNGWLCTYYIYDDLGLLRVVIPPKAVIWLSNSTWNFSNNDGNTIMNELCFQYQYDERQRMIAKKVPGSDWVYMVYDQRDRLVFTQDGNMRKKTGG